MARLKEQYVNEIAPALNKKFGYKSETCSNICSGCFMFLRI